VADGILGDGRVGLLHLLQFPERGLGDVVRELRLLDPGPEFSEGRDLVSRGRRGWFFDPYRFLAKNMCSPH